MGTETRTKKKRLFYIVTFVLFLIFTIGAFLFIKRLFGGEISPYHLFHIKSIPNGLLMLLIVFLYIFIDSLRLYYIMRTMGGRIHYLYIFKLSCINIFVSNITPMATGGGFMQIYLLHKKGLPVALATAITSLRTFLTIIFFILIFPLALIFLPSSRDFLLSQGNGYYFSIVILCYLVFLALITQIFINQEKVKRILNKMICKVLCIFRLRKKEEVLFKTGNAIESFFIHVNMFFLKKKSRLLVAMFLTLLYLCIIFLVPVVLVMNYSDSPPLFDVFINQIIVTFFTYFAFTPGASGIAELIFAFFNSSLIGKENLLSFTFMWRFMMIYAGMILGAIFAFFEFFPIKLRKK